MENGHRTETRIDREAQKRVCEEIERYDFTTVVQRIGVNKGLVYRSWKYGTYSPTLRRALGMAPLRVEVKPCKCGEFHEVPWCTKEKGAPVPETEKEIVYVEVQPKPKPKRRSQPKRWRFHYEAGRGSEGAHVDAEIRAEIEAAGCDSFTEYVNLLRRTVNE